MLVKDILGFTIDGEGKTLSLEVPKRKALLNTLQQWLRASQTSGAGVPFDQYESVLQKVRHAFFAIPAGQGLLSPCNHILQKCPPVVYFHQNKPLCTAMSEIRTLLQESTLLPTPCNELVMDWPDFVGVMDAFKHGVGGVIIGEQKACTATVFHMEWPPDTKVAINTVDSPMGCIMNSDLEMAGLLLLWLVMEDVCQLQPGCHVALFSDNSPTVSWVKQLALRRSVVAARLLHVLALRLKCKGASPLTPLHVAGCENAMTDIPSRSWGSEPKWLCKLTLTSFLCTTKHFPYPNKNPGAYTALSSASVCT